MPEGVLSRAVAAFPFVSAQVPLTPAAVRTAPEVRFITRSTQQVTSAMNSKPFDRSSCTPRGAQNEAAAPTPSTDAATPEPAAVDTALVASVSARTRGVDDELPMYKTPRAASSASAPGAPKVADEPTPSASAHVLDPASVCVAPVVVLIRRMRQPVVSETYSASPLSSR
jgi:hypothetical protein